MAAGYRADYSGIGDMLTAPFMVAEMRRRAEKVKARAEALAPVDDGEYKRSFDVSAGVREGRHRRAYGRVTNTAPHAFYVEFGTTDTPRFRVLGRALDAATD